MKRLPSPAEREARMRAIWERNKETPAREKDSSTKSPMVHGGSTEETRKPGCVLLSNQEVFDSTGSTQEQMLFERYGDIMGIVDNHPLFKRAIEQWSVYPQALTQACKEHGVDKVLDALRYTANYRAAKWPGKFLFSVLRNGKRAV